MGAEADVSDAIQQVNEHFAPPLRVRRFALLEEKFSQEHGELTPTGKLRRTAIAERHRDTIEKLYGG